MGEQPLWHRTVSAARYLGVSPWDLEQQPYRYLLMAEHAQIAEHQAAENRKDKTVGR